MKIIRPTIITDVMLISSDVAETDYAEFAMGTTYAPGARVIDSTGVEILNLDVAPAMDWAVGDLITGQSSAKMARVVAKLTTFTYQIRERTGTFTLGEIIGVTGVSAKLADQGAAHPTITAAVNKVHKVYESLPLAGVEVMALDVAPATAWVADRELKGQTSGVTCKVVVQLTALTYLIKERTGAFTLGEVIGVSGIAAELADQGGANPTVAAATNTGNYPPTDLLRATPLWWKEVSATNRWKAFDAKNGAQVSQASLISYSLAPGLIDSIALLNLDATSVRILMTVALGDWDDVEDFDLVTDIDGSLIATVYDETIDLISTAGIIDGWTYHFEPIIRKTDIVRLALPPYGAATIAITITNTDGIAKVGEIVVGRQRDIGQTLYAPEVSIVDYSQKSADENGVYAFAEGPFSKKYSCSLRVSDALFDEVFRLLALYRATPVVWVALEDYAAFIAYGKYNSFTQVLSNAIRSDCSLEIEGMT
jgi:hypothetical protein